MSGFIEKMTVLETLDNSTPRLVRCIEVYNPTKKGTLCDFIKLTVLTSGQRLKQSKKIKYYTKGSLVFGVLVHLKKKTKRFDGSYISFNKNRCIILNKQRNFLGTRVLGPLPLELQITRTNYKRLITLSLFTV